MKFSKIAFMVGLVALLHAPRARAEKFISFWTVSENQLNIPHGGRANTIAIHPGDPNLLFVASESGGLFRSTDRGLHWSHVDNLPVIYTRAVVYVPSNPNIVLVSTERDFKTSNGGGIWRSTNGGTSWTQMTLTVPGRTVRLSAHEISIMPRTGTIVAGTSEGVFLSSDSGATWTYSDVFSASDNKQVISVLATDGRVYAGGPMGIRMATGNPLSAWTAPLSPGAIAVTDLHAFGRSPLSATQAFVATSAIRLFVTNDGGMNWSMLNPPAGAFDCGGIGFIKAILRTTATARFLDLYYGSRCWLWRLQAPVVNNVANFGGQWLRSEIDHADTRDLAFVNDVPALLATDGGLHRTADQGVNWTWVGGGRLGGFNALQMYDVTGQYIEDTWTKDLYAGTQDNDVWAFNMWGNVYNNYGAEGFNVELERRVPTASASKVTYDVCGNCNKLADRHLMNAVAWNNPPASQSRSSPVIVRRSHYIQSVGNSDPLDPGLAMTENSGGAWHQFAAFQVDQRNQPKVGHPGTVLPLRPTIVYQPFRTNEFPGFSEAQRLIRIHRRPFSIVSGDVFFPAMTGFGALGINETVFRDFQVYGVDTANPYHLIAPDIINQRMMESRTGGETWQEIPGLTALVTENGKFLFRTNLDESEPVFPHVTAVSFSPQDPNMVLIGTNEGGIFRSDDNGATWQKIAGSDLVTKITAFHWMDANNVFVSTYGRGLWRLRNRRIAVPDAFEELCGGGPCDVLAVDGSPERPPFAGSVLVFEGSVFGVRTDEGGRLREVLVKPGSSVVFTGDQSDPQDDVTITESDGKDLSGTIALPKHPDGWLVKGVVFGKDEVITGAVFGETETSLVPPPPDKEIAGPTGSPTDGRPYIRLITSGLRGFPAAAPGESFELAAIDFPAGTACEVLLDGVPVKGTVTADGNGAFTMTLTAPMDQGYHRVQARVAGGAVLDGSMMVVKHMDGDEKK